MLNADDEYVSQFGRDFHGRVVTFGLHKPADVSAQNIESRGAEGSAFDIVADGEQRARPSLPLLGEHNIYNALAGSRGGTAIWRAAADGGRIAGHVISR